MKKLKSILSVLLALMLCVTAVAPAKADTQTEGNAEFDEWLLNEFVETMESDYLSMHYNVVDYKAYGIEKPEVTLGEVSYESYAEGVKENQEVLDELHAFDYDSLSESQKVDYDVLEFDLEQMIIIMQYPQFEEMYNPYTGALSNLVTNFTEFVFYNDEDFEDYLTLLGDYARYMDDMMTMTKQQAADGYFMPDATLDVALEDMQDFIDKGEENPLIVIFDENVDSFEGGLDEATKTDLKARNKEIVLNQIIPAYTKNRAELETLRGSRKNELGAVGYEGGEAYYEALAKYYSDTEMSVEEMYDFVEEAMTNIVGYFYMAYDTGESLPKQPDFDSPDEVLEYLQDNMEGFPEGPEVTYTASYLDPSIANPSTVAYYVTTPIDEFYNNVIKINADNVKDDMRELYSTLAHEGFPGHLYQFTWYLNTNPSPLRSCVSMMGYQEGWAMYVENIMIRRMPVNEFTQIYTEANTYYGYVYQACMELGVNGMGWTVEDLWDYLDPNKQYYTLEEVQDTYDYLISMPGVFLAYGVGDAYFMTLRAMCEQSMGQNFDEEEFHLTILTNGPRMFDLVEQDLKDWITESGYEVAKQYTAYDTEVYGLPDIAPAEESTPTEESVPAEESSAAESGESTPAEESSPVEGPINESSVPQTDESSEESSQAAVVAPSNGSSSGGGWLIPLLIGIAVLLIVLIIIFSVLLSKKNKQLEQQEQDDLSRQLNQPTYGGNPYQQNGYQQPYNGQYDPNAQYGQNQYGQNQYGQNAQYNQYGQNAQYNQNGQYGQNQYQQPYGGQYNPNSQYGQNQYGQNVQYDQNGQYAQNQYQQPYNGQYNPQYQQPVTQAEQQYEQPAQDYARQAAQNVNQVAQDAQNAAQEVSQDVSGWNGQTEGVFDEYKEAHPEKNLDDGQQ